MRSPTQIIPSSRASNAWTSALGALRTHLAAAWRRMIDGVSRQAMNGRVLHRLSLMTDRELSDIGLSRYDVSAAKLSENGDAIHYLVARRDERHGLRRGQSPF